MTLYYAVVPLMVRIARKLELTHYRVEVLALVCVVGMAALTILHMLEGRKTANH